MSRGGRRARICLRGLIGTILLVTAVGKLLDLPGFAKVLGTYQAFPESTLFAIAAAVVLAELVLAVWLFSGWRPRAAAFCALGIHLAYAAWSAVSIARGLHLSNCGCFGVFWPRPLGWSTVVEDLVVAAACGALVALTPRLATA